MLRSGAGGIDDNVQKLEEFGVWPMLSLKDRAQ